MKRDHLVELNTTLENRFSGWGVLSGIPGGILGNEVLTESISGRQMHWSDTLEHLGLISLVWHSLTSGKNALRPRSRNSTNTGPMHHQITVSESIKRMLWDAINSLINNVWPSFSTHINHYHLLSSLSYKYQAARTQSTNVYCSRTSRNEMWVCMCFNKVCLFAAGRTAQCRYTKRESMTSPMHTYTLTIYIYFLRV